MVRSNNPDIYVIRMKSGKEIFNVYRFEDLPNGLTQLFLFAPTFHSMSVSTKGIDKVIIIPFYEHRMNIIWEK